MRNYTSVSYTFTSNSVLDYWLVSVLLVLTMAPAEGRNVRNKISTLLAVIFMIKIFICNTSHKKYIKANTTTYSFNQSLKLIIYL